MNKEDLINEVAGTVKTKKAAQAALDCLLASISRSLKKGENVTLSGFGTFKVVERQARRGRNPSTGEQIEIKATRAPKFSPAKALKDAVQ